MSGGHGLFHIDEQDNLVRMVETPYAAEAVLQELLASHPDLLGGGQMTPEEPRRWLLVKREYGVPDRAEAAGYRFSLDHLFVDQDAVPTLVEVKRASDTRIRREVVGQMLDYAANGVRFWPAEALQAAFSATQDELKVDPQVAVHELTGDPETTVEAFFERVLNNLRAGVIRLVFVADAIPDELRRVVEFLNEQMDPAEVYAVEVKQFAAEGFAGTTIVPAVYGRTAAASQKAARRTGTHAQNLARASAPARELTERLSTWAKTRAVELRETPFSLQLKSGHDGSGVAQCYFLWDTLDFFVDRYREAGGEGAAAVVHTTLQQLTPRKLTSKRPGLPAEDALKNFDTVASILDEFVEATRGPESSAPTG